MDIGKLIHQRRTLLGLTLEEVGDKVGVTKGTVHKWESGNISNMRRDKIMLLSQVLQISPVSLITGDEFTEDEINPLPSQNIYLRPIYNSVAAGFNVLAQNTVVGYMPTYIASSTEQEKYIWVNVVGDSMSPLIDDGAKVLVRLQESVDSCQIAVVLIDGEEGVIRKVVYSDDWIELHSINPYYPPRRFETADIQRIQIIGLVKEVSKKLC